MTDTKTVRERRALAVAREMLEARTLQQIAESAAVTYQESESGAGEFGLRFLGREYLVSYPDGQVCLAESKEPAKHAHRLIALHYLAHADGSAIADRWVSFRELPDGLVYDTAFRGRVEPPLIQGFSADLARFRKAALRLGGAGIEFGDMGYAIDVLPRVRMAVIFYLGDDELPPAVSVLYDSSAGAYLPTEDLAVLGGLLVGALFRASR